MKWRAVVLAALALGCGPPAVSDAGLDAPSDAPLVDAPSDVPPIDAGAFGLSGPDFAFVGVEVCFSSTRTLAAEDVASFVFGDGETATLAAGIGETCHTYDVPGPIVVGLEVMTGGRTERATKLVHVVFTPLRDPPPRSTTILAADVSVFTVEPDADLVVGFAIEGPSPGAESYRRLVGDRPRTLAHDGTRLIVACQGDGTVHVLPEGTGAGEVVSLGAGSQPFGVLVRDGFAYVSLYGAGSIAVLALSAGSPTREVARIAVGADPRGLALRPDGLLLVTHFRSGLDAARLSVLDVRDPTSPVRLPDVVLPREEGRDADTDNDGVLSFVQGIALSPDGGRALIGGLKANVVAGLARTGLPLTSQTTARGALAEILLGGVTDPGEDSFRRPLDDMDSVGSITFSRMGERVYFTVPGAETVLAVDAFSLDVVGSVDDVGHEVDGLVEVDGTVYLHAALSREVRAYDVRDLGSGNPPPLWTSRTVSTEPLLPTVLEGAILFHRSRDPRMSRTRYLSCASCHRDGESDNLVWDFTQRGEGLRNTTWLLGRAGMAHGPLHWTANFDEVQDFEHDIRAGQGGVGFLPDALFHMGTRDTTLGDPKAGLSPELDALAAYLTSLDRFGVSPDRTADAAWEAARARGEALFAEPSRRCTTCHAGPRYTDSAFTSPGVPRLHDVGTIVSTSGMRLGAPLTGLDTPTLRGLWASAPYLHDGSAATLEAVLTVRNASDRHGVTSDLTSSELGDLVTFLRSLDDRAP